MCLILASPSSSLYGIAPNKLGLPPLLLNENVLCLVVVWVDSLQPEGAFMSLTAKLHKILE